MKNFSNKFLSFTLGWLFGLSGLFFMVSYAPQVHAQDPVTCSASVPGGINFGNINTLSANNTDITGSLNIQCQSHVRQWYYVTVCFNIGDGANPSNGGNRTLVNGSSSLSYQLYQDAARTQIWGSVNSTNYPNPVRLDFYLGGRQSYAQTLPVYGRLFGSQTTAITGLYQDSYVNPQVRITGVLTYSYGSGTCDQYGSDAGQFSTLNVVANVVSNCLVQATPMNFGTASLLNQPVSSTSTLGVQCTQGTPYQIGLNLGQHATGSTRYMSSGSAQINYGLYQDSAHTQIWDNLSNQKTGVGSGNVDSQTIYGLVPAQTSVPAGAYSDTVQVLVNY